MTIKEVCESFLDHCEGRNRRDERMTRKMLVVYRGHINNHILHPEHGIGSRSSRSSLLDRSATSGSYSDSRCYGADGQKNPGNPDSVLEHAISEDWVATNAAHGVKVIGPRGEGSKKIVPPSKDDMRVVIDAAGEDLRLMLIFAASTGARAGEQWATRWRDVNFDKCELTYQPSGGCLWRGGRAQEHGRRADRAIIGAAYRDAEGMEAKVAVLEVGRSDLPEPGRPHLGHDNLIKRQFLPLFDELKTVKRFNWHGLRHFAVSCWIEPGSHPRRCRPSPATHRCRSRWTDMATYSRATITGRRWTRLPRDYLIALRNAWRTSHVPSM